MSDKKSSRLMSIDVLRGFDMFWIIGGPAVLLALFKLLGWDGFAAGFSTQMEHVEWEGLRFIDCVFPLFIFISGLTYPFSHAKQVERGDSHAARIRKVLWRMVILLLLGLFYNGSLKADFHHPDAIRYFSVLGHIGISWAVAALIYMHTSWRGRIGFAAGGLLLYGILLLFTAPDAPAGAAPTSLQGCFVGWLDRLLTPGFLYCDNLLEPSGPVVSALGYPTALLGMLAGDIVRSERLSQWKRVGVLAICGVMCVVAGLALAPVSPIVKKLWSPTFMLVTAGVGFLLFALFHALIDVKGWTRWGFLFQLIGVNAIFIYLSTRLVNYYSVSELLFGGLASLTGGGAEFILALGSFSIRIALLYYMFRKKLFIKV